MSIISDEEQKEFHDHLNLFFKNPLITDEEKYNLIDRMEKKVEKLKLKIADET